MISGHSSYRTYLRSVLAERVSRNPSYSLRALARHVGMAPSSLSEVLKGSKNLSLDKAHQVALRLGLKAADSELFCLLVQAETARSPELRESIVARIRALVPASPRRDLSLDLFRVIADWYHLPILEMTRLKSGRITPAAIAARLGITEVEALAALERLERLELIERIEADPGYRKTSTRLLASSPAPDAGLRRFHRQMLEKAIESLETQTAAEKYVGSETFAFDPARLREAGAKIEELFDRLVATCAGGAGATEVYHLGVQLFRVTDPAKSEAQS